MVRRGWGGRRTTPHHSTRRRRARRGGGRGVGAAAWRYERLTVPRAGVGVGAGERSCGRRAAWRGPGWAEVGESSCCGGWGHRVRASAAPNPSSMHLQLTASSLPSSDQLPGCPLRACRLWGGGGAAVVCGAWCASVWCNAPVAMRFRLCLFRIRWTTIRG